MIKLRTILLSNYPFYILLFLVSLLTIVRVNINYKSNFKNENTIKGRVQDIYIDGPYLKIILKSKDKITCTYYFKDKDEKNDFAIEVGDIVLLKGSLKKIDNNTIPNTFNYKKYLYQNKQYYLFEIEEYKKVKKNCTIYYFIKNRMLKHIEKYESSPYLYAFILGDTSHIKREIYTSFQEIGISHLFAISGMHISLLSGFFLLVLKKMKVEESKRYMITSFLLFFYLLLSFSPSVLRSFLFFFLLSINKIYYFYIKTTNIFLLTLSISLLINPFFIYHIGFLFSYTISFFLIISIDYLKNMSRIKQSFLVSFISFLVSFPICIYHFYQVNLLSIFYNLFFVPFVSIFLFPLTLLTFVFPFLDSLLNFIIHIFENIVIFLNTIDLFKLIFSKPNFFFILVYYVFIILFIVKHKKVFFFLFLFIAFFHYQINSIISSDYLVMIDIGQGDSILLHSKNKNILIDTGGKSEYFSDFKRENASHLSDSTISMLKSLGIKKLNLMVLSHGDMDHLGESFHIVNNFKVDKVLFNEGNLNYNEKKLIKLLKQKHIEYEVCYQDNYYKYNNITLHSLNSDLSDENDSSIVFLCKIDNFSILLTGDASIKSEEYILKNYDIPKIDILKAGHHGSKTSTSEELVKKINPKLALISVGKENKFNHPSKETIDTLKKYNVKVLETKDLGSILLKIKKDNLIIKTYKP